jgi:hypothetical protein
MQTFHEIGVELPRDKVGAFLADPLCLPRGRSQVVTQRILIPPFGGSSPPAPAMQSGLCEFC